MGFSIDFPAYSVLSNAAARSGADIKTVLNRLGASVSADAPPLRDLPLSDLAALIDELRACATNGHFAFAFAEVFHFDGLPEVATFLSSSDSLREAERILDWVPQLVHPGIRFRVSRPDERSLLELLLVDEAATSQQPQQIALLERIAAVLASWVQELAPTGQHGSDYPLEAVHFCHEPQCDSSGYESFFRCPVLFGQPRNQLIARESAFDLQRPGGLPDAHAIAEQQILSQILNLSGETPLPDVIEALLRKRLDLLSEPVEQVAAALKLHPRTLQRRLRGVGTDFSTLRSRVRHQLATEMLQNSSLDVESIGIKLGYEERRSFTAAFRNWQGVTPSDYRAEHRDS